MVVGVKTDKGEIRGAKVVVATGIWTRQLSKSLPVYAVSHPYSLSLHRTPRAPSPFVRWPEQHVYGRDHGLMDGIGTYDHEGHPIDPDELGADAYGPWDKSFDKLLARAYEVLPEHTSFIDSQPFNGMLTVTPDGIPFVGQVMEGLYCAVAVWVTHAGGSAELLAKLICGSRLSGQEKEMLGVLDPLRFDGEDQENLKQKALRAYSDILHTDKDALKGREAKL
jgi:sarcosine oxidase